MQTKNSQSSLSLCLCLCRSLSLSLYRCECKNYFVYFKRLLQNYLELALCNSPQNPWFFGTSNYSLKKRRKNRQIVLHWQRMRQMKISTFLLGSQIDRLILYHCLNWCVYSILIAALLLAQYPRCINAQSPRQVDALVRKCYVLFMGSAELQKNSLDHGVSVMFSFRWPWSFVVF